MMIYGPSPNSGLGLCIIRYPLEHEQVEHDGDMFVELSCSYSKNIRFVFAELESLLGYGLSTRHSMIQLELHLAVYNQLERAIIKTPMPMPHVPVRGGLLQP